jgi:hypothetical protein
VTPGGRVGKIAMALLMKLSHNGLKGYLGRGTDEWACLVEKERAARLTPKEYQNNLFYGTEDDWWLSVGTQGARNGYLGFYAWNNAGWPNWQYDAGTKRLKSANYGNGPMSLTVLYDGYIYCWAGDGYAAADIEFETVSS